MRRSETLGSGAIDPVRYADAADLASLLADPGRPVAVIAGAWLSVPLPSAVMDAWRWKQTLIVSLSRTAGWRESDRLQKYNEALSNLGSREDLKLERVLEAIEQARPSTSERIVAAVASSRPNPLHEYLSKLVEAGAVSCVVDLNFDELLETAVDPHLAVWTTGEEPRAAKVLHVHGRASRPESLRHVLSRFALRLPRPEHVLVAGALAGEVVTLGWAATDPDVVAALSEGHGPIHVLIAGDEAVGDTAEQVRKLAANRPVSVYRGGFQRMADGGAPEVAVPQRDEFTAIRLWIDRELSALAPSAARRAYSVLSYEYSIGVQHGATQTHRDLLSQWRTLAQKDSRDRELYLLARAETAQATGQPARAALLNLVVYARTRDPYLLSEVGDALERTWKGRSPLRGLYGISFHSASLLAYRRRRLKPPPWVRARRCRSLLHLGRDAAAAATLDEILSAADDVLDIWVRAHCHRLRAIATAKHSSTWRSDINAAIELFRFAGRTLEVGSTFRAESLCELLEGKPGWPLRADDAVERAAASYGSAADFSAHSLLRQQRWVLHHLPRRLAIVLLKVL